MIKKTENLRLKDYNSYQIDAICKLAFFPSCEEDFSQIFREYTLDQVTLIGGGYNVILSKEYYDDVFVIIGDSFAGINLIGNDVIVCDAGASTEHLSEFALENGLTGAEIFYDIPSSIGGAVVMNAGASGEEIKDILLKVRYLDTIDLRIKEIQNEDIDFQYRNSFFQKNTDKVVLKAWFKLAKGNPSEIRNKMNATKKARWAKQPRDLPNCGSVFKRPKGFYVGAMIDELNLKGYTVGGAQISKKHGGFIVNLGGATGSDILAIINVVQSKVEKRFGVNLEIEQRII